MGTFEVKTYEPSDFENVRQLYAESKKRTRSERFDKWRLYSTPIGNSPTVLAMAGGRCVGLYTMWPTRIVMNGEVIKAAQSMDTLTHSNFRGIGIFTTLAEKCYQLCENLGFELMYGFPNNNSFPGFVRRLNWDHVGDVQIWSKVKKFYELNKHFRSQVATTDGLPDPGRFEKLAAQHSSVRDKCSILRDSTWLQWRYGPSSEMIYNTTCMSSATQEGAIVVMAKRNASWGAFAEADQENMVELIGTHVASLTAAIRGAANAAFARGSRRVLAYSTVTAHIHALSAAGFKRDALMPLIVRKQTTRTLPTNPHAMESWNLIGGDWDAF